MANRTAEQYIAIHKIEESNQANFRALWQETADLEYPRDNQIDKTSVPGVEKSNEIYDTTAVMDSISMTSGISSAFIPSGQLFFGLRARRKELNAIDVCRRWMSMATQIAHEEMFESNLMLQLNETLRSSIVFGTGNIYTDFNMRTGSLYYRDYSIGTYQLMEDESGFVDTIICKFKMTARQAEQKFGDKLPDKIKKALEKPETENKEFDFLHFVEPRKNRNPKRKTNINMPVESVYIAVDDKQIVEESGYEEFPFATPRWAKSTVEKYGRGQGTEILPDVRVLQQLKKDFIECGNKWNNPALQVLSSFEGRVRTIPGAQNIVEELGSIASISDGAKGSFPITKDMLIFQQDIIHKAFFKDVFEQLGDLKGDRRTTTEILERINEGLQRLALPVARLQSELFNPLIKRTVLLLIRNGRIPYPPAELQGQGFGIEYRGRLALALRNQQSKAFQQWLAFVAQMDLVFTDQKPSDNIDSDGAVVRMGESLGVNIDDIASEVDRDQKRMARAQMMQAQMAAQAAQIGADAINKTSNKPEAGSPAEAMMGQMGGEQ